MMPRQAAVRSDGCAPLGSGVTRSGSTGLGEQPAVTGKGQSTFRRESRPDGYSSASGFRNEYSIIRRFCGPSVWR